ncbi:hypothetical protein ABT354_06830 [Streptomyces sp. NPDC000594]|uniref:hypothetical protein n=1 Tax=Streptomyces sp. NPDC000594 TaxID=3154261 RepID=UPI003322BF04
MRLTRSIRGSAQARRRGRSTTAATTAGTVITSTRKTIGKPSLSGGAIGRSACATRKRGGGLTEGAGAGGASAARLRVGRAGVVTGAGGAGGAARGGDGGAGGRGTGADDGPGAGGDGEGGVGDGRGGEGDGGEGDGGEGEGGVGDGGVGDGGVGEGGVGVGGVGEGGVGVGVGQVHVVQDGQCPGSPTRIRIDTVTATDGRGGPPIVAEAQPQTRPGTETPAETVLGNGSPARGVAVGIAPGTGGADTEGARSGGGSGSPGPLLVTGPGEPRTATMPSTLNCSNPTTSAR